MKKLTALIFALLLVLPLLSCGGMGDNTESSAEQTTAPQAEQTTEQITEEMTEEPALSGIDLSEYKIIRSERASDYAKGIISKFRKDLNGLGVDIRISEDWLKDLDPASAEVAEYKEILVGTTNRPESQPEADLRSTEGRIFIKNNKIVLSAGSEAALSAVCAEFFKHIRFEDGKMIFDLKEDISFDLELGDYSNTFIVADQKASKVRFYGIDPSDMSKATEIKSFEFERYNIAGLKLRVYNGKKVLIAAYGSRFGKMIDIETGEILFHIDDAGSNPHSPELTPNGVFCIASSTGNVVKFYNVTDPSKQVSVTLTDAHGVLYDPDTELVFAVGSYDIRAFKAELGADGIPVITEDKSRASKLPTNYAHDLQPVQGNTDLFWITTSSAVYQYSVSEKKIITDYEGNNLFNVKNVKGIGNFADGSVILITPDGKFESWTSETVTYYHKYDGNFYKFKIGTSENGIYKVRVENYDYQ